MAHHSVFRHLDFANDAVMRVNLLLLMAVAFLPFPTRLMAQAIHSIMHLDEPPRGGMKTIALDLDLASN